MDLTKINFRFFGLVDKDGHTEKCKDLKEYLEHERSKKYGEDREVNIVADIDSGSVSVSLYLYEKSNQELDQPQRICGKGCRMFELTTKTDTESLEESVKKIIDFSLEWLEAEAVSFRSCVDQLSAMQKLKEGKNDKRRQDQKMRLIQLTREQLDRQLTDITSTQTYLNRTEQAELKRP